MRLRARVSHGSVLEDSRIDHFSVNSHRAKVRPPADAATTVCGSDYRTNAKGFRLPPRDAGTTNCRNRLVSLTLILPSASIVVIRTAAPETDSTTALPRARPITATAVSIQSAVM